MDIRVDHPRSQPNSEFADKVTINLSFDHYRDSHWSLPRVVVVSIGKDALGCGGIGNFPDLKQFHVDPLFVFSDCHK